MILDESLPISRAKIFAAGAAPLPRTPQFPGPCTHPRFKRASENLVNPEHGEGE